VRGIRAAFILVARNQHGAFLHGMQKKTSAYRWRRSRNTGGAEAALLEKYLQATAGSRRHFSLVKVLLRAQSLPSGECLVKRQSTFFGMISDI
jgi:hypothetical protein